MFKKINHLETLAVAIFLGSFFATAWANLNVGVVIPMPFGLTITGGDLVFPLVYVLNDIATEFFGKKKAIMISVGSGLLYMLLGLISFGTTFIPNITPEYSQAARVVFAFSPRVAISSIAGLLIGTTFNAWVFQSMKERGSGFKKRAWVSTLFGETSDSLSVNIFMFAGILPMKVIFSMILTQIILKLSIEALLLFQTEKLAIRLHKQIG